MSQLNTVNMGQNRYCGPAVLSILTGKSTDECARVISSINGKYVIEGIELKHLLEAADRLGFDCESISPSSTLFGSLVKLCHNDGIYIVTVTKHFIVIEVENGKIYFNDNHVKEPMPAASSARLQQSCKAIHKITKRREPIQLSNVITCDTKYINDRILVTINSKITFDIEKYNKELNIARFGFNTIEEMKQFIDSLNEGAIEWQKAKPETAA